MASELFVVKAFTTFFDNIKEYFAMGLHSRKKLYSDLCKLSEDGSISGWQQPETYKKLSNEVYGPQAMIYLDFATNAQRVKAERWLEDLGYKVDTSYSPGSGTTSVQVSWFKGLRWDE